MKNIAKLLSLILCFITIVSLTIIPANAEYDPENLQYSIAPSDSVKTLNGSNVEALIAQDDWSPEQQKEIESDYELLYPNAELKPNSITSKYNCHSFAWYNRSNNNQF